jgi:hypothetical protein
MGEGTAASESEKLYALLMQTSAASLDAAGTKNMLGKYKNFSCDPALSAFYMLSRVDELDADAVKSSPGCTLSITSMGKSIYEYFETKVTGKMSLMTQFNSPETKEALLLLAGKSQYAGYIISNKDMAGNVIIKIIPDTITYRNYSDMEKNLPEKVLLPAAKIPGAALNAGGPAVEQSRGHAGL